MIFNKNTILKMVLGAAGAVLTIASQAIGEKGKSGTKTNDKNDN